MKKAYTYEEKSRKYHMARVDWLLLFLALFLACSAGAYFFRQRRAARPTQAVRYTIWVPNANTGTAQMNGTWEDLIPVGAKVTSQNGTATLGRVEKIEVRPSVVASVFEGELVWIESPDTVDLRIDVVGEGVANYGDGIRIQDVRIAAGGTGSFRIGKYYAQKVTVIFVETESLG